MTTSTLFDQLDRTKVLAILHGATPAETVRWCERAWSLGVALVEVPIRADGDLELLAAAVGAGRRAGHPVGAGTVTSAELTAQVAELGGAFTVAPGLDEEVAAASLDLGLAHLPGVATATEIQRALRLGLPWQKAFPASSLGPGWFTAQREPFRTVKFVATGGVNVENAASFLKAGAAAVSLGSAFARSPDEDIRALIG
ncbi:MAG: bifunctional 4-hydroxy-2-oxoglutarate aldolase/2-dehydro-3-deoxy-phosphogluconate aldolase [Actinobacteria bacterium]|nr:bifunctional 4-hydroxy-2-oxoglutarate aldolase/2-dehydro-3-deoxy-phosphogluconate aldolase [Actinomycetota bacterium]